MNKTQKTVLATMALTLICNGIPVQAKQLNIDTSTPQGRSAAYAALSESNAVGNASRLLRSLKGFQRGQNQELKFQADRLVPQLEALIQSLGGDPGFVSYSSK